MAHKITTVILYCTNDHKFLKHCIDSVRPFSEEIIIPVGDKFWNGEEENLNLIAQAKDEHQDVNFIDFKIDVTEDVWFWEAYARELGFQNSSPQTDYILYVDADEVFETEKFIKWLDDGIYRDYDSVELKCYWYFREVYFQAIEQEANAVLISKKTLQSLLDNNNYHFPTPGGRPNLRGQQNLVAATALDGTPMYHHYSWVRTREEMLLKVRSWGHQHDKDWTALVEKEFSRGFMGKDFAHGYRFEIARPLIKLNDTKNPNQFHQKYFALQLLQHEKNLFSQIRLTKHGFRQVFPKVIHEHVIIDPASGHVVDVVYQDSYNSLFQIFGLFSKLARFTASKQPVQGENTSWLNFISVPIKTFINRFFVLRDFRDGFAGVALAKLFSYYYFYLTWLRSKQTKVRKSG